MDTNKLADELKDVLSEALKIPKNSVDVNFTYRYIQCTSPTSSNSCSFNFMFVNDIIILHDLTSFWPFRVGVSYKYIYEKVIDAFRQYGSVLITLNNSWFDGTDSVKDTFFNHRTDNKIRILYYERTGNK